LTEDVVTGNLRSEVFRFKIFSFFTEMTRTKQTARKNPYPRRRVVDGVIPARMSALPGGLPPLKKRRTETFIEEKTITHRKTYRIGQEEEQPQEEIDLTQEEGAVIDLTKEGEEEEDSSTTTTEELSDNDKEEEEDAEDRYNKEKDLEWYYTKATPEQRREFNRPYEQTQYVQDCLQKNVIEIKD
jgi:hypothetical protein